MMSWNPKYWGYLSMALSWISEDLCFDSVIQTTYIVVIQFLVFLQLQMEDSL